MHNDFGEAGLAERIRADLMPGHQEVLRRLFNEHGARPPQILWSPGTQELQSALLRRFAAICEGWMDESGRVPDSAFDAAQLGALADWLMLVKPLDDGDFLYTHYGQGIVDHYGHDMTGARASGFGGHISDFLVGVYRAAMDRREWVMSEHQPPARVFVRTWRRLVVPMFAPDNDTVVRFAVINLPDNALRAGLELVPDPVFVADADERVWYANKAARKMFSLAPVASPGPTLRQLTGIGLSDHPSPEDLLTADRVSDSVELTLNGGIAERLVMSVGATEHCGTPFYVAVMRLIPT